MSQGSRDSCLRKPFVDPPGKAQNLRPRIHPESWSEAERVWGRRLRNLAYGLPDRIAGRLSAAGGLGIAFAVLEALVVALRKTSRREPVTKWVGKSAETLLTLRASTRYKGCRFTACAGSLGTTSGATHRGHGLEESGGISFMRTPGEVRRRYEPGSLSRFSTSAPRSEDSGFPFAVRHHRHRRRQP